MLASNLLVLCFFLLSAHAATSPAAPSSNGNTSFLELNVGLNLSVRASFNVAIAAYGAYFSPILSSSGFNSTDSSKSLGFSVGFLFSRSSSSGYVNGKIYLAVCGGLSGNYSKISEIIGMWGRDDAGKAEIFPSLVADGYVVPVWIANPDYPLSSVESSLVVVAVSDQVGGATSISNELQLRDHNGRVVWSVSSNASSMMEMQDAGNLVIYDSMSTTNVVWQSSTQPRDTLLQGQMLTVGKELTSNDSSYSVRMEKGGLVFYDNNAQFIEQPSPYWVIPILYDTRATNLLNLNSLVFSPPCSNDGAYGSLGNSSLMFFLEPGPCSNMTGMTNYLYNFYDNNTIPAWSFVKLERDGRFYAYAVNSGTSPPSIQVRVELYTLASYATDQAHFAGALDPMPYSWWGECDVPMACGPLGVCSSQAGICTCPDAVNFLNPSGSGKGCTRSTSLPPCSSGNEHMSSTDYLQLNHTASIFLFGGWAYNSTSAAVEICKKTCSSNCSCTGFFYQSNTSACFFITKEITLLNVTDTNLTYTDSSSGDERVQEIFARNYVTYLKVTSAAAESSTAKHVPIAVAVLAPFVACLVLGLAVYLFCSRKCEQESQAGDQEEELELRDILPVLPTRFSYQDLHKATGAFSKLLGAGGCGSVYSGVLPDGRKIAVKFLEFGLLKGHAKQFLAEVSTMGRTSHHNIVRLVGFCWEVSNRLLVYEYVERGSLDHWLFVKEGAAEAEAAPRLLDWKTRYNVALGMARGLSYLHEDCPQPILHFDIKPQNILLDGAFVAKLADFGMSRLMQRDVSEVVTGVRGTPGYIAPEWVSHGVVGKKSDVYSMGMVMLEIVGGRRNVDVTLRADSAFYPEEWYFPSWAAEKCNRGLMMEVVDKRLLQTFDEEQAQRLIHTAFWCIHENPSMRPYAPTVVQWLEGNSPVKEPPFSIANAMSYPSLDSCQKSHCSSFTLDAMSNHPPLTR